MQPTESFSTGRQLALLMQRNFPDRDWMFDLAQRARESRDTVEWHLQELATNLLKYGALLAEAGALDVSGDVDEDDIQIIWTERGGPGVKRPNGAVGYGSRLVIQRVSGQLGGSIDCNWSAEEVIVTLILKASKLSS